MGVWSGWGSVFNSGSSSGSGSGGGIGPRGAQGAAGPVGLIQAAGAPDNGTGVDGQSYLNRTNGDLYEKSGGVWSLTGTLRGPAGVATVGPIGLLSGSGAPSDAIGTSQQHYIRTSNWDFYKKVGGTWGTPIGTLKGEVGATGTQGGGFQDPTPWVANTAYPMVNNQRPVVTYLGETYAASTSIPGRTTFTPSDWVKLAAKGLQGDPGAPGEANIPENVALLDAEFNDFGVSEISGGLMKFVSRDISGTTNGVFVLDPVRDNGCELGFSATSGGPFVIRVPGTLPKGFNCLITRESTVKVSVVPHTTAAIGHSSTINSITATAPAFVNQYDTLAIVVRYKPNSTSCDFLVRGPVVTS